MEKVLSALLTVAPLLNELIYDDVCVSINDKNNVLAYYPAKTFDLRTKVWTKIGEDWLITKAMKERRKIIKEQDSSVVGIPYMGIALPIIERSGEVVGGISILQSTERLVKLQDMANKLTDFIDNLTSTMEEISAESEELTATTEELAAVSDKTTEHVNETEEIAAIIEKISRRINLIGLNAAIEAARVGNEGRGFKVVADEIRRLADQSAESLKRIDDILIDVQQGIGNLNEGVKMINYSNNNQATVLESIATEIEDISVLTHHLSDFAKEMTDDGQIR